MQTLGAESNMTKRGKKDQLYSEEYWITKRQELDNKLQGEEDDT